MEEWRRWNVTCVLITTPTATTKSFITNTSSTSSNSSNSGNRGGNISNSTSDTISRRGSPPAVSLRCGRGRTGENRGRG